MVNANLIILGDTLGDLSKGKTVNGMISRNLSFYIYTKTWKRSRRCDLSVVNDYVKKKKKKYKKKRKKEIEKRRKRKRRKEKKMMPSDAS